MKKIFNALCSLILIASIFSTMAMGAEPQISEQSRLRDNVYEEPIAVYIPSNSSENDILNMYRDAKKIFGENNNYVIIPTDISGSSEEDKSKLAGLLTAEKMYSSVNIQGEEVNMINRTMAQRVLFAQNRKIPSRCAHTWEIKYKETPIIEYGNSFSKSWCAKVWQTQKRECSRCHEVVTKSYKINTLNHEIEYIDGRKHCKRGHY